jgi:hypothetical protein
MIDVHNRPVGYFLSARALRNQEPALMLWLHRSIVESVLPFFSDDKLIQHIASENQVPQFQGYLAPGSQFGFGGVLRIGEWSQDFLPLTIPIPACEQEDGACHWCEGKLEEKVHCHFCSGSGKEDKFDGEPLWPIVTTLGMLFERMYFNDLFGPDSPEADPPLQLMLIELFADRSRSVFGMHGRYSIGLVAWLATFPQSTKLQPLVDAMNALEQRIFSLSADEDKYKTRAVAEQNGWLNISCRGNACGLHPHHSGIRPGRGVEFSDHNIDTPAQALILLAALAALTDMAMEAKVGAKV